MAARPISKYSSAAMTAGPLTRSTTAKKLFRAPQTYDVALSIPLDNFYCTGGAAVGAQKSLSSPSPTLEWTGKISTDPPFTGFNGYTVWTFDEYRACLGVTYAVVYTERDHSGAVLLNRLGYIQIRLAKLCDKTFRLTVDAFDPFRLTTNPLFAQTLSIVGSNCRTMTFSTNEYTDFAHERAGFACTFGIPTCATLPAECYGVSDAQSFGKNGTITVTPCSTDSDCGTVHVTSVASTCTATVTITFDKQVLLDDFGAKLAFSITPAIGGGPYYLSTGTGVQVSDKVIEFDVVGWSPKPGDTWNVTAQIEWIHGRVNTFPLSGTVTGSACPVKILSVTCNGTQDVLVAFDQPVTVVTGPAGDASFNINTDLYTDTASVSANVVKFTMGSTHSSGEGWFLNSTTPTWLTTPASAVSPDSGTTV